MNTVVFVFVFALAAFVVASAATYLVAWAAEYVEPVLAAQWAARTAQEAQEAWASWAEAESAVREEHLAALSAIIFSKEDSLSFERAWAEARAYSDKSLAWAQEAQARAERARAWAIRAQARSARRKG